jgi:hypothetical protein
MAETSLTTISGTGNQAATQSPQSAGDANPGGTNSSRVQPGTASDLLRSQNGVKLNPTPLTTVNLNSTGSGTTQPSATGNQHHINPVLGAFSIALFVLAIVLFWMTSRSVKNTTN